MSVVTIESDEIAVLLPYEQIPFPSIEADEVSTLLLDEVTLPESWYLEEAGVSVVSTLVPNFGAAGTDYHAYGAQNDFITLPSGATAWQLSGNMDYIAIPRGVSIDNVTQTTFEWLFILNDYSGNHAGRLWSKRQTHDGSFDVYVDDINGCIVIQRGTILNELDVWQTPNNVIDVGQWCNLQITWNCDISAGGDAPIIIINDTPQELLHTNVANPALWADDSNDDAFIGNVIGGGYNLNATIAVFRHFTTIKTPSKLTTDYLADVWRTSNKQLGPITVSSGPSNDTDPILTIEKNLSNIYAQTDFSTVVTQCEPRGIGQKPAELRFNNPNYYPNAQALQLYTTDTSWAYFRLQSPYVYANATYSGQPLPSTMLVGTGLTDFCNISPTLQADSTYPDPNMGESPPAPYDGQPIGRDDFAGHGLVFKLNANTRFTDASFFLYKKPAATAGQKAHQFLVGIYYIQNTPDAALNEYVPSQGPLVWYIGDLDQIQPDTWAWYTFPLQQAAISHTPWDWYALVISVYPTTGANWEGDILWVGFKMTNVEPTQNTPYQFMWTFAGNPAYSAGSNVKNWASAAMAAKAPGAMSRPACVLHSITTDLTSEFQQSLNACPGWQLKMPIAKYSPTSQYWAHYQQAPWLIDWEAYSTMGKVEGTYKSDTLSSHDALFNAGANYLSTVSNPTYTISLSALDLYDLDPQKNWAEELRLGTTVMVLDAELNIQEQCLVTKITKDNLEQPHDIQIELNSLYATAARSMANINQSSITYPKYLSGQTVSAPYIMSGACTDTTPASLYFEIKEGSTLVPSVTISINPTPYQVATSTGVTSDTSTSTAFKMKIDGVVV